MFRALKKIWFTLMMLLMAGSAVRSSDEPAASAKRNAARPQAGQVHLQQQR